MSHIEDREVQHRVDVFADHCARGTSKYAPMTEPQIDALHNLAAEVYALGYHAGREVTAQRWSRRTERTAIAEREAEKLGGDE